MNRKTCHTLLFYCCFFFIYISSVRAQPVDCEKDIKFIIEIFRHNYAGFPTLQSQYGETKLDSLLTTLKGKAENRDSIGSCEEIIKQFVDLTSDGHVNWGRHQKFQNHSASEKSKQVDKNPSFKALNSRAALLILPSFSTSFKDSIDRLIETHHDKIISLELLIVDVRGNGGGSDASYRKLIPYFYTEPIVRHSAEFLASEDNIDYYQKIYNRSDLPVEVKEQLGLLLDKMVSKRGEFVLLTEHETDTLRVDRHYDKPAQVAFIFDEGSGSSTDQLLLAADQSSKVTFFGKEPTGGPLDFSNLRQVTVPSGVWWITVPTSRSTRLPEKPYDPIGTKPDVKIPENFSDPINFILRYYELEQ